jgi:hypothetical protein
MSNLAPRCNGMNSKQKGKRQEEKEQSHFFIHSFNSGRCSGIQQYHDEAIRSKRSIRSWLQMRFSWEGTYCIDAALVIISHHRLNHLFSRGLANDIL